MQNNEEYEQNEGPIHPEFLLVLAFSGTPKSECPRYDLSLIRRHLGALGFWRRPQSEHDLNNQLKIRKVMSKKGGSEKIMIYWLFFDANTVFAFYLLQFKRIRGSRNLIGNGINESSKLKLWSSKVAFLFLDLYGFLASLVFYVFSFDQMAGHYHEQINCWAETWAQEAEFNFGRAINNPEGVVYWQFI